jgi:hypothetical protein
MQTKPALCRESQGGARRKRTPEFRSDDQQQHVSRCGNAAAPGIRIAIGAWRFRSVAKRREKSDREVPLYVLLHRPASRIRRAPRWLTEELGLQCAAPSGDDTPRYRMHSQREFPISPARSDAEVAWAGRTRAAASTGIEAIAPSARAGANGRGGHLQGSGAQCFVCPVAHRNIWRPTIPDDYSSTTTIPKLNFRFPERTVTMQEAKATGEGRWGK